MSDVQSEEGAGTTQSSDPASDPESAAQSSALRPFLKWAGGKSHLLPEILKRAPKSFDTYFEPFLGGGAVFFALAPARAVLSDINPELINIFQVVQQHTTELIEALSAHQHSEKYFYKVRGFDRSADYWVRSSVEKASRLIYLNKTCYNGLYRVNSRGEFNVPFGDYKNPRIFDVENLFACREALSNTELRCCSFEDIEESVKEGDFVYFDPPYVALSKTANFTAYTKDGFTDEMQKQLLLLCKRLDKKGAKFLLSNSSTEGTKQLYSGFQIDEVEAPRAINSKAEGRGRVQELLVRNYV